MAQRGPKPTPTNLLRLRGSWRGNTRPQEPTVVGESPPIPRWLNAEERKVWKRVSAELSTMGVVARIDGNSLARYVSMMVQWRKLHAFIVEHGETAPIMKQRWIEAYYDTEGTLIPGQHELYAAGVALRPQVKVWLVLADRLLRLEQQFGMTPSGRAAIGILLAGAEHYADSKEAPNPKRFLDLG
jgi:P27 family predicted phage terminase small subunit